MELSVRAIVLWISIASTTAEWVLNHSGVPPFSFKHPEEFTIHLGWFNTEQRETTNLTINVKKSEAVGKSIPLHVTGEGGRPVLTSLINMQHSTFYHDLDTQASFSLTSFHGEPFTMKGSFQLDKEIYEVEPYHANVHKRSLRADRGDYIIKRRSADSPEPEAGSDVDHRLIEAMRMFEQKEISDRGRTKRTVGGEADYIDPPTGSVSANRFQRAQQLYAARENEDSISSMRKKRQTLPSTTYIVELYIIVDYYLYVNLTQSANRIGWPGGTDDYIAFYIGHQANEIDVRYRFIDSSISPVYGTWTIGTKFSHLNVAKVESNSVWTYPRSSSHFTVHAHLGLAKVNNWVAEHSSALPNSADHFLLITSLDLQVDGNPHVDGISQLGGICSNNRTSFNQFGSASIYAHELGHNLGARHDGDNNICDGEDQLIMSAVGKRATNQTLGNNWHFSKCSVLYFDSFLRALNIDNANCLRNPGHYADSWADDSSQHFGQKIPIDEQCKLAHGPEYSYVRDQFASVCSKLPCVNESLIGLSDPDRVTLPYTSCGNKKWCVESRCVYDPKAPEMDEKCPFPDDEGMVFSNSDIRCNELNGAQCAQSAYARVACCRTCQGLATPWLGPNCTHGDASSECSKISLSSCLWNAPYCCETCCPIIKPLGVRVCTRESTTTLTAATTTPSTTATTTPTTTTTSMTPTTTTTTTSTPTTTTTTPTSTITITNPTSTTTASTRKSTFSRSSTKPPTTVKVLPKPDRWFRLILHIDSLKPGDYNCTNQRLHDSTTRTHKEFYNKVCEVIHRHVGGVTDCGTFAITCGSIIVNTTISVTLEDKTAPENTDQLRQMVSGIGNDTDIVLTRPPTVEDINECVVPELNNCTKNEKCTNKDGYFTCTFSGTKDKAHELESWQLIAIAVSATFTLVVCVVCTTVVVTKRKRKKLNCASNSSNEHDMDYVNM